MIGPPEIEMLIKINKDPGYDDSNHRPAERELARRLYRTGLIDGALVEGSDTAVEHLFLTDMGQLAVKWYGPTNDDDEVVDWFALRMKQKLLKRSIDSTKSPLGWRSRENNVHRLFERLLMEVGELGQALYRLDKGERIIDESTDCANVAMMIADFARMVQDDAS